MTSFGGARLRHRRLQTGLAVAALGTAVALPIVLLAVGGGVYHHELGLLQNSGFEISIAATGAHGLANAHALTQEIDALADVAHTSPVLSSSIEAFDAAGSSPVLAEGVVPAEFSATLESAEAALFPNPLPLGDPSDAGHFNGGRYDGPSAGVVMISGPFAAAGHLRVGDPIALAGADDPASAVNYTVAGLFGTSGPELGTTAVFGLVLPLSDLQVLTGTARTGSGQVIDAADTIGVALAAGAATTTTAIDRVASEIRALVPYYSVTEVSAEAEQLQNGQAVLTGFYLGLSGVSLIVGMAFLTLLLLREVDVGRRELGIRRAIGESSGSIALGILRRGASLASAGAVLGAALGVALVALLAADAGGAVGEVARLAQFDPLMLLAIGGTVVGLSLLSSGAAARAALRRPIPEVLR